MEDDGQTVSNSMLNAGFAEYWWAILEDELVVGKSVAEAAEATYRTVIPEDLGEEMLSDVVSVLALLWADRGDELESWYREHHEALVQSYRDFIDSAGRQGWMVSMGDSPDLWVLMRGRQSLTVSAGNEPHINLFDLDTYGHARLTPPYDEEEIRSADLVPLLKR